MRKGSAESNVVDMTSNIFESAGAALGWARYLNAFLMMFMGWLSVSVEVFLRAGLGERYLSWFRVWMSYVGIFIFLWFFGIGSLFGLTDIGSNAAYGSMIFFSFLYAAASLLHRLIMRRHMFLGMSDPNRIHSWSSGYSHLNRIGFLARFLGEDKVNRFLDPLLVFVVGFIVISFDQRILGIWLLAAGVTLFFNEQLRYSEQRNKVLNAIDGYIENQHMDAALEGKSKKQTQGFSLVAAEPKKLSSDDRKTLKDIFTGRPVELRQMAGEPVEAE